MTGIESDGHHVSGPAFKRWASASAWLERGDVDVTEALRRYLDVA